VRSLHESAAVRRQDGCVGKMVEVRATIVGYRDPTVELPSFSRQEPCFAYLNIALEFPQNVSPRPPFVERDASFRKYEEALQKPMRVEATLQARFDAVFVWKDRKRVRIAEGQGFGRKHAADARLVLQRMSDVITRILTETCAASRPLNRLTLVNQNWGNGTQERWLLKATRHPWEGAAGRCKRAER